MRKIVIAIVSMVLFTSAIGRMQPSWAAETKNELYYDYSWYSESLELDEEWNEVIREGSKEPTTMYSIASNVNVRELPNTNSKVFDILRHGTSVEVVGEKDGWSCISTCDGIAFVKSEYLSDEECKLVPLGVFKITHYCCESHHHICNDGTKYTRMGTEVRPGIVSVDPKIIPLGSKVMINGVEYSAEDTGGAIRGAKIDMCVETHKEAMQKGVYKAEVYLIVE